jgi:hypothetical protein
MSSTDFYIAHCNADKDSDGIFSDGCLGALMLLDCVPVMPPDLRAKRTVVVRFVDKFVYDNSAEELKKDIGEQNQWLQVVQVIKLPSGTAIKLICKSREMAARCLKEGFYMVYLSFPPHALFNEDYIKVSYCYKCYEMNSHTARDCPRGPDYLICSLCSSNEHSYRDCDSTNKKCINCAGNHSTLALSCPSRKYLVSDKRVQRKAQVPAVSAAPFTSPKLNVEHLLPHYSEVKQRPNLLDISMK